MVRPVRTRRRPGLTLVEVLVVMFIATLLAGMFLPAAGRARHRALVVRTEAIIAGLETALAMYESDYGDFPRHRGPAGSLLAMLSREGDPSPRWRGPYLRLRERDLEDGELLDPWGGPFYYLYPQRRRATTPYVIFSAGADREPFTDQDIGNW